jgi:phenylalanyl-tRNA synthetase alpha chain
MSIDDKVRKTLAELGVRDAHGVHVLFGEVHAAMEAERQDLISRGAPNESERSKVCKALRDRWLARKNGIVSLIDEHWLKKAAKELKPLAGRAFNEFRRASAVMELDGLIGAVAVGKEAGGFLDISIAGGPAPDLTLPGYRQPSGSIHPVTRVRQEIEDIFIGLGFRIETGPEIESAYYNFDALNIPETHPSRDDWDTLYVDLPVQAGSKGGQTLLRTHTSPVQIRAMERSGAPLYIIVPGKVYRHDNPDSSHATMFHQIEGLAVDRDITFADLKGTLDFFAKKFFGEKICTSFHPSFFPFTEPSGEVAISCTICDGKGCPVCKMSGWVEVMGCGMVHPQVLENCGIDSAKFAGWAFGLGLERYTMMKYGINDIQLFFQSDLRFLEQF